MSNQIELQGLIDHLVQSIKDISFREDITESTTISSLEMDSLDFLELFFKLQMFLGVEMSQKDLERVLSEHLRQRTGNEEELNTLSFFKTFGVLSLRELAEMLLQAFLNQEFQPAESKNILAGMDLEIMSPRQGEFLSIHGERLKTRSENEAWEILQRMYPRDKNVSQAEQMRQNVYVFAVLRNEVV